MRAGRLRLMLYLGGFVLAFVAAGLILAFASARPPHMQRLPDPGAFTRSLDRVQRAELPARLDQLADQGLQVTVYDAGHRVVASNVQPPLAPEPQQLVDADGRTLDVVVRPGPPRRPTAPPLTDLFVSVGVLLAVLSLLVIVIVRHVGKPLQQLESAARGFGSGDLTARANITRSDELGEVGRAFDQMADRVTALMTAQRELMANVSHELHTPLARVQVAVDLMLDGIDDRVGELLPQISKDLCELQRLIDDVMQLSRFELARVRGNGVVVPLKREVTSIAPVLHDAMERFREHHPERSVEADIAQDLPQVSIDRMLVRRVFENVLDNAAKYSDLASPISVSASVRARDITISIRDHGIGIDADDLPHVFTPFFRSDRSRSRTTGGFGLGLAFTHRVIEALGGSIQLTSEPDVGTTVTIVFPAK